MIMINLDVMMAKRKKGLTELAARRWTASPVISCNM